MSTCFDVLSKDDARRRCPYDWSLIKQTISDLPHPVTPESQDNRDLSNSIGWENRFTTPLIMYTPIRSRYTLIRQAQAFDAMRFIQVLQSNYSQCFRSDSCIWVCAYYECLHIFSSMARILLTLGIAERQSLDHAVGA
jgi:hypothetical protein